MVKIHKRGAVYGVIGLMMCLAVYLNWSYVKTPDDLVVAGQVDTTTGGLYGDVASVDSGADGVVTSNTADGDAADTTSGADTTAQAVSGADYFAQSRLSREKARDEAISILKETMDNEKADDQSKTDAGSQISKLAEYSVTEARIESLIKAKGYSEAVVFLGADSVNVIVQPPEAGFTATDAAKIRDIVVSESTLGADQIKIVEAG